MALCEASALPALASLQPLAVLGAPYVLPGRARPPPGLAGLAPRDPSDCSWSETDASATERVKGKGRGEGRTQKETNENNGKIIIIDIDTYCIIL